MVFSPRNKKNDEILSIVSTKPGKQKVLRRFLITGREGGRQTEAQGLKYIIEAVH